MRSKLYGEDRKYQAREVETHEDTNDGRRRNAEGWAQATAALMIIGLIFLIISFFFSIFTFCYGNYGWSPLIAFLLICAAILQFIGLIVYAVNFKQLIYEGRYDFTWAYGFGWGATILAIGCIFLFCCLPKYEEHLNDKKTKYFYTSW
ncbi:PERP protein, partial [Polypterus senegalus]